MTTKEEIIVMKNRIDSMDDKLEKMDLKLDLITQRLLDPDTGVTSRVNQNTAHRKLMSKALWAIYVVTIGLIIKTFWV